MNFQTCALLASLALTLRWGTSLWPHSGEGRPPMFGDFEAQRHWMEVTTGLPLEDWYRPGPDNDLQYWGLDYPPLTAYHSLLLGKISAAVNSSWTALHSSRGHQSADHRLFMRGSVLATDLLVLFPAVLLVGRGQPEVIASLLAYPGLILIDHGHFQYNSASLGLLLLAVAALLRGRDCIGAGLFVLALNYKQMELYHALPFFCYLLGRALQQPSLAGKLGKLLPIALTTVATFALVWAPFLLLGPDTVLQVLRRCFPFGRGLFEDKVANFWCSLDVAVKLRQLLTTPELASLSAVTTLLLALPSNLHLLRRPHPATLLLAIVNTALVFFMFSFQVHEKSILLAAVPACLLHGPGRGPAPAWLLALSTFSMVPLLAKDGLLIPGLALTVLHLALLHGLPGLLPPAPVRRPQSPAPSLPLSNMGLILRAAMLLSLLGCLVLTLLSVSLSPPARYPDLWPLAISVYSAAHFLGFIVYFHHLQFSLPDLGLPDTPSAKKTN